MNKEEKKKLITEHAHSPDLIAITKKIQESLRPIMDVGRQVAERLAPFHKAIQENSVKIAKFINEAMEASRKYIEFQNNLVTRHKHDKVFLSPYFLNFTLNELYELFDNEIPVIEIYDTYFKITENLDKLQNEWIHNDYFKPRIPILKSALAAHARNEYELSVPIFLIHIEGILSEILAVSKHSLFKHKLQSLFPSKGSGDFDFEKLDGSHSIIEIICDQIFESTGKLERNDTKIIYPNRHKIQHGIDYNYYKDIHASVRCIMVLDFLRAEQFQSKEPL